MTQERMTPLRERMMEDMRIRGMGEKAQKSHIRAIKDFAKFLKRSPDTATPEELRAYQLHMTDTGVTASTFNTRIIALRFFFSTNLRARRDEALHAVPPQTKEAARCVQR
jgi:integrase/recombinase XerD